MSFEIQAIEHDGLLDFFDSLLSQDALVVDKLFEDDRARQTLFARVQEMCRHGHEERDPLSEFCLHAILSKIYALHMTIPPSRVQTPEASMILMGIRRLLEDSVLAHEDNLIQSSVWDDIPHNHYGYSEWLLDVIRNHPSYRHAFYEDFLRNYATRDDLRDFFIQETTVDTRFDDFLALIQVGTSGDVKLRIASNYWDEMGNGSAPQMHTALFSRASDYLGGPATVDTCCLTTEALVCGNLTKMLSLRRQHFYKAIGHFATIEYCAPPRFKQILYAWQRNGLESGEAEYQRVHAEVDPFHADDWFCNVIAPVIEADRGCIQDITSGALYRLNTSQRYLDMLTSKFTGRTDASPRH